MIGGEALPFSEPLVKSFQTAYVDFFYFAA